MSPNTAANGGQILTDERINEVFLKHLGHAAFPKELAAVRAIEADLCAALANPACAPVAWMKTHTKECTSDDHKKRMENAGFGVWGEVAAQYTIPLYSHAAPAIPTVDRNAVPSGDVLRAIVRSASTSATDGASPQEYVLAGWNAAIKSADAASVPSDYHDAYRGARDDLQDWKNRAQRAEESCRRLTAALNDENGPTHMGEPADGYLGAGKTDERALFEYSERASDLSRDNEGDYSNPYVQSIWDGWQARAVLAAVPASEPDMRKLLDEHDRGYPKPHHCHQCGLPLIKNPHPDAGTPDALLAVGAVHECLPCVVKSCHSWYRRAMEADKALRDAAAAPAPVSGMPDLAGFPVYERMARGRQDLRMEPFYAAADVERLLNPTGATK